MSDRLGCQEVRGLPQPEVYPERRPPKEQAVDRIVAGLQAHAVVAASGLRLRKIRWIAAETGRQAERLAGLDDTALRLEARAAGAALRRRKARGKRELARAFAAVVEAADRSLGMRPYPVQVMGAAAMLSGTLAEMATGEGKTLTGGLAASVAVLAGMPTHVVTVNDYLAGRDAELMRPLYAFFGIRVGKVVQGQDAAERRWAYSRDVVYCTNKELAFDYLRDRMVLRRLQGGLGLKLGRLVPGAGELEGLRLQGLHFVIVDEADSVLIDEARTPLVISGECTVGADVGLLAEALELVERLREGVDYRIQAGERRVDLTQAGCERLAALTSDFPGAWQGVVVREELARQALTATRVFQRDVDYLVQDGKICIVDEYTGRVMPDRYWGEGLHQMVELNEGLEPSVQRTTVARITYQRFFRRYHRLAGMSGTARSVARELWQVYRLAVTRVPTHRPLRRRRYADRVYTKSERRWQAVAQRARDLSEQGLPVLLGTRSVAASEVASQYLRAVGLDPVVLNAAQDRNEAAIVAGAGAAGRVTVATNMAGRGTDIKLPPEVIAAGGLQVLMSERHDARRIDLQLAGRAGRQGEPGSFQAYLSLDDELLARPGNRWLRHIARLAQPILGVWVGRWAARCAQRKAERVHARMRRDLQRSDALQETNLAFAGPSE